MRLNHLVLYVLLAAVLSSCAFSERKALVSDADTTVHADEETLGNKETQQPTKKTGATVAVRETRTSKSTGGIFKRIVGGNKNRRGEITADNNRHVEHSYKEVEPEVVTTTTQEQPAEPKPHKTEVAVNTETPQQPEINAQNEPAQSVVLTPKADKGNYSRALGFVKIPRIAPEDKIDRGITVQTVIPKGQWITGGNISYSEHTNDNYKFIVLNDWSGSGYNLSISPFVGYAFRNNVAAGARFAYDRSLLRIDNIGLDLGDDLNFSFKDVYQLNHGYFVTGFLRTYINLGDSKRFALYNEVRVTMGGGQGKIINGRGESLVGTYQSSYDLQIGMAPGLVAFISDFAAVEVSVGVLGFNFKWVNQTTNQIETGYRRTSSGNFKINLFTIGLGLAFYL